MDKNIVKQGYELAQKELKEKQIAEVKNIVGETLRKIEALEKRRTDLKDAYQAKMKEIDESIRILKMDIDDLKEGRLDRILERQSKDEKAKDSSVVVVERIVYEPMPIPMPHQITQPWVDPNPWKRPYWISYQTETTDTSNMHVEVTGSICQFATRGAYLVGDHVIHLR